MMCRACKKKLGRIICRTQKPCYISDGHNMYGEFIPELVGIEFHNKDQVYDETGDAFYINMTPGPESNKWGPPRSPRDN